MPDRTPAPRWLRRLGALALTTSLGACAHDVTPPTPRAAAIPEPVSTSQDGDPRDPGGSHFRYGTLSWAPTGTPGQVVFSLRAGFRRGAYVGRCAGACPGGLPVVGDIIVEGQGPTGLAFGDGTWSGTLRFRIVAVDLSDPDPNRQWVLGVALDPATSAEGVRHTYAGAGPYAVRLNGGPTQAACCRIGQAGFATVALNNRAGQEYPLTTVVAPLSGNRSPVSGQVPIVSVVDGAASTFFLAGADPDGDRVRWRFATDAETGGCCNPPGLTLNPATGQVTWNNLGLNQTNYWQVQFMIEDLDAAGNVKSKSPVDILLRIIPSPPFFPPFFVAPSPADGSTFSVPVGGTLNIGLAADDPDAGASVAINHAGLPAGASFSATPGKPGTAGFSWTPGPADIGSRTVTFFATDNTALSSSPRSYTINIVAPPTVTPTVAGTLGAGGWYTSDVFVSWTVVGNGSPVTSQSGCGPTTVTADGTFSLTCTATSSGGTTSRTVTVKRDATGPAIVWAGNAGTYTVDQAVAITCTATDATSGLASSTCANVSGPAYTFPLGTTTLSATATDLAGNTAARSTSFTVRVTSASLCALVKRWVDKPGVAHSLCVKLENSAAAAARGSAGAARNMLDAFVAEVEAQTDKSVAAANAATLIRLAQALRATL